MLHNLLWLELVNGSKRKDTDRANENPDHLQLAKSRLFNFLIGILFLRPRLHIFKYLFTITKIMLGVLGFWGFGVVGEKTN